MKVAGVQSMDKERKILEFYVENKDHCKHPLKWREEVCFINIKQIHTHSPETNRC